MMIAKSMIFDFAHLLNHPISAIWIFVSYGATQSQYDTDCDAGRNKLIRTRNGCLLSC